MARSNDKKSAESDGVISIIAADMRVTGDLETDGTVRVEGSVQGNIHASKAVVVGKEGQVEGDVHTQDALISGRVHGSLVAASRLEVHEGALVDGDIHARRLQLEEGAMLNGTVRMSRDGPELPSPGDLGSAGGPDRASAGPTGGAGRSAGGPPSGDEDPRESSRETSGSAS